VLEELIKKVKEVVLMIENMSVMNN